MTDTHNTRTVPPGRTLHRSRDERIVAGVCGGLAEHLGINAWWFRWAFIFLAFFGGVGFLIYAIAWLVIPGQDDDDPIVTGWVTRLDLSDGGTIFGVVLVGLAAVILVSRVVDVSGSLVVAAVLFVFGMLLYRGDLKIPGGDKGGHARTAEVMDDTTASEGDIVTASNDTQVLAAASTPTPAEPARPPGPPKPPRERSMLGRLTLAVGLIIVASIALIDVASTSIDVEPIHYLAVIVGIVGLGLLVSSFLGRARWLIIVGAVVLPFLWVATLVPTNWTFSAGEFEYAPISVTDVQDSYDQGIGQLTIDLRGLTADELGQIGTIEASLGLGEMVIRVPDDVAVTLKAKVGAGEISGPFRTIDGVGLNVTREFGGDAAVLLLDLEVGAGVIDVSPVPFHESLALDRSN
ncbi:MAG: PspC domain-containing protein [Actinomycetia bacterium]|nr:PspC domain-containing protein [Actinomycetes bacterium]